MIGVVSLSRDVLNRSIAEGAARDPSLVEIIAAAVGFTHSSFTRLFTRHMGMTPTAFRELLQC